MNAEIRPTVDPLLDAVWSKKRNAADLRILAVDGLEYAYHIPTNSVLPRGSNVAKLLFGISSNRIQSIDDFEVDDFEAARQLIALQSITRPHIESTQLPIQYLAISPTLSCNLSCTYCYNFQESPEAKIRVSPKLGRPGIRKILQTLKNLDVADQVNLAFIGGEPLLHPNHLDRLARHARYQARKHGRNLILMVTTNGLNLGDSSVRDVVIRHDIRVSISLDGPPQWHDETRRLLNGKGSFEAVSRNIDAFFRYYPHEIRAARATYRLIPGRLLGTYKYLRDMGFNDISTGSGDFETVDLSKLDRASLFAEIDDLANEIQADFVAGRIVRHAWFTEVISNLQLGRVKDVICGATRNHIAFDVFGRMQACHRYLGNEAYELTARDLADAPSSSLVQAIRSTGKTPDCPTCWARSLCGGECFHVGKEIEKHDDQRERQRFLCDYKRRKYNAAMRIFVRLSESHPDVLHRVVNPLVQKSNTFPQQTGNS